ncbi:MAG: hypothetical protein WCV90_08320 [Candidatus Woesearchaeota archaeon]
MTIELYIEPGKTYKWNEFKSQKPPYSIALDGFVSAPTHKDPRGPYANFDHHTGVDRFATRSTSDQVHLEINMDLFDTFKQGGIPTARIYVNDCDEDTCLAAWLLMNHDMVIGHASPPINRLVYCEDRLDSTAGAYPFGETEMRQRMAWIFEPYNQARFENRLSGMSEAGMKTIMEAVFSRISAHVINGGEKLPLVGQYEKIGGGEGWTMVHETGPASRMAMYNDGINAFAAWLGSQNGSGHRYVLGRKSVWVKYDIPKLYRGLNKLEGDRITKTNRWNGSNTIGGSPRFTGSRFGPEELEERIKWILNRK